MRNIRGLTICTIANDTKFSYWPYVAGPNLKFSILLHPKKDKFHCYSVLDMYISYLKATLYLVSCCQIFIIGL